MAVKQVSDLHLFADHHLSVRGAGKGFLISLKASNRYAAGYLRELELAVALLADYAESQEWPAVGLLTTSHIEEYLYYLQTRPRWFGQQGRELKPPSQSYIETQYRRLKRFFAWLVERGHCERNPLNLIPHPHIDERVIPTISERQQLDLLRMVDPSLARTSSERFRFNRDRAVLYLLIDTPGRRNEIATIKMDTVDLDSGAILVMGKGRRERWMPLGNVAKEALWDYLQARSIIANVKEQALWLSEQGQEMQPNWLYLMLKRLGERAGISNLHTHRFRHTYAVNALRSGMPERVLMLAGGWKRIPETYFRTLGAEDVARVHREISPADRLGRAQTAQNRQRKQGKARGKL